MKPILVSANNYGRNTLFQYNVPFKLQHVHKTLRGLGLGNQLRHGDSQEHIFGGTPLRQERGLRQVHQISRFGGEGKSEKDFLIAKYGNKADHLTNRVW